MPRLFRLPTLIVGAVLALSACATPPAPPPPPPPSGAPGATLRDWRSIVTAADRDRYARRDERPGRWPCSRRAASAARATSTAWAT